jgi:hypothetical protein
MWRQRMRSARFRAKRKGHSIEDIRDYYTAVENRKAIARGLMDPSDMLRHQAVAWMGYDFELRVLRVK